MNPSSSDQDPGPERKPHRHLPVLCILGAEFAERLAFGGLAMNLVTYLTTQAGYLPSTAGIQVSFFIGTCYVTPLLGALLADSKWGRYHTILRFMVLYFMGAVLLSLSSFVPGLAPSKDGSPATYLQTGALSLALTIIAFGTGGIKPNVSAFGADQLDGASAQESTTFFAYFYLVVNLGSLVGITVIVYVEENVSWACGFGLTAFALGAAIIIFSAGSWQYRIAASTTSSVSHVVRIVAASVRHASLMFFARWFPPQCISTDVEGGDEQVKESLLAQEDSEPSGHDPLPIQSALSSQGHTSTGIQTSQSHQGSAGLDRLVAEWQAAGCPVRQRDDGSAVMKCSASQVADVRQVLRLLPVFFASAAYFCLYNAQMGNLYVQQGNLMDRHVMFPWWMSQTGKVDIVIPAASMALFNTLSVVIMVPVISAILSKLQHWGVEFSRFQKIGCGMCICAIATMTAALVEYWRLQLLKNCLPPSNEQLPHECLLSVLWQLPQYVILGMSEVLASVGLLELFYSQAPTGLRSCAAALNLLSNAAGSYLAGSLIAVVRAASPVLDEQWLPQDLNKGRLDLFLGMLVFLMCVNLTFFGYVATNFRYVMDDIILTPVLSSIPTSSSNPDSRNQVNSVDGQLVPASHAEAGEDEQG